MKLTRFKELQILSILRQAEGGVPVTELCREHGMSNASFYKWRAKYGGMDAPMIAQTKTLEGRSRKAIDPVNQLPGEATNGLRKCLLSSACRTSN